MQVMLDFLTMQAVKTRFCNSISLIFETSRTFSLYRGKNTGHETFI